MPAPAALPTYRDRSLGRTVTRIAAGEFLASRDPRTLITVLGSCVSVCLVDKGAGVAGMNHYMLPGLREGLFDPQSPVSLPARYGAQAMELLINRMLRLGAVRPRLTARVYGGASVIQGLGDVGLANIAFARNYLRREKIAILEEDVGGLDARRVVLDTPSGAAQATVLDALKQKRVGKAETSLAHRVDDDARRQGAAANSELLF